jgi:hypothetical protein
VNALIGITAGAALALAVFGIMFRRNRKQALEIGELRASIEDYDNANRELARALAHALKPPATHDDAVRVLDHLTERSLSAIVSDTDT